jgi:hypothetical protein
MGREQTIFIGIAKIFYMKSKIVWFVMVLLKEKGRGGLLRKPYGGVK